LAYFSSKRRASARTGSTAIVTTGTAAQLTVMPERSDPPAPFSPEEIQGIREALGSQDGPTVCPACGGELKVSGAAGQGFGMPVLQRVECVPCSRAAIIVGGHWVDPDK
jgi:hypothetical protein